jgi:hypothetical protein
MDLSHPYIVRGVAKGGTVTYNCATPEWAVRKHRDMITRGLSDVTITGPDGQALSLIALEGASVESDVPIARVAAHQC